MLKICEASDERVEPAREIDVKSRCLQLELPGNYDLTDSIINAVNEHRLTPQRVFNLYR
jgi:hypothetical protein